MINFKSVSCEEFLTQYWQKKACVFRQAMSNFNNPISPDELAGLAMEDDIESRIVIHTPHQAPFWHLKRGPFGEADFANLPETDWTLLVQGVDRFVPQVADLLTHFNFLPSWRVDDVMISYAVKQGGVGPHYDNYDVFLYQAKGQRQWSLTTQDCSSDNALEGVELRIMKQFKTEQEILLEEGDMLYLPPHVAHHGVAMSDECMTYSFGYRSYQSQELWDSLGDYLAETKANNTLYKDPSFLAISGSNEIPIDAWEKARETLQTIIDDKALMQEWFGRLVTSIDQQAEALLPVSEAEMNLNEFKQLLFNSSVLIRSPLCRFAYYWNEGQIKLFVNGSVWCTDNISPDLVKCIADHQHVLIKNLDKFAASNFDMQFLCDLWNLQWLELS